MTDFYRDIGEAVAVHGLVLRGGFVPGPDDGVPLFAAGRAAQTVLMVGNAGQGMWTAFMDKRAAGPHPLDFWAHEVIGTIAARFGARAVYPDEAPPLPFQRWARRAWPVSPSPIGLLIDPEFGLWHAFRAALLFPDKIEFHVHEPVASPCETCASKPCLTTCPIGAFTDQGFDYMGCRRFLKTEAGHACLTGGCKARAACPVGVAHRYPDEQVQFHMRSFSGIGRRG